MFCPSCGSQADLGIKFCKQCGFELNRVRGAIQRGGERPSLMQNMADWDRDQLEAQREERRRKNKKSPEEKRYEEIKAGVITTCVGVGATVFLYFFMSVVAANEPKDADIINRVWLAGLVPTIIGLGILFNGLVISRKIVELKRQQALLENNSASAWTPVINATPALDTASINVNALPAAQFDYSVTEHTTAKLKEKMPVPASRDTN
jgi:hypothetical protein